MTKPQRRTVLFAVFAVLFLGTLSGVADAGQRLRPRQRESSPFAPLVGTWAQIANGKVIAHKSIFLNEFDQAQMEYVELDPNISGVGRYSPLDIYDEETIVVYEDYGDKISRHVLVINSFDELEGSQTAYPDAPVVTRYVMRRIE